MIAMDRRRWAVVVAGLVLGVAGAWRSIDTLGVELGVADAAVGLVLVGCGVVGWERRADSRTGPLMALGGVTWLVGSVAAPALFWYRGPLVHLTLSYPTGRLRRRLAELTVLLAYVDALVRPLAANDVVTLALAVLVGLAAVDIFVRTSGPARRAGVVALGCTLAYAAALAIGAGARLADWDADSAVLLGYDAVVASIGVVLLLQLLFGHWSDAVVADLVVALGEGASRDGLRGQLARALGDPSLVVGYWIDADARYVDDRGRPLAVPAPGGGRSVTEIDDDGTRVAVLVHDATTMDDPQLLTAVAAATRLAVTNARLQADIQNRVTALADARRRTVEAGDDQRRRLEVELSQGAARRLDAVSQLLGAARGDASGTEAVELDALETELRSAQAELHELAQGIRPKALGDGGLAAALPALVRRATVPVELTVDVGRLRPAIEAAVYFVCSESLANIAKHFGATRASGDGRRRGRRRPDSGLGRAGIGRPCRSPRRAPRRPGRRQWRHHRHRRHPGRWDGRQRSRAHGLMMSGVGAMPSDGSRLNVSWSPATLQSMTNVSVPWTNVRVSPST
jgi:signal transduction histidine kinase